jgi:thioredoxin reductase (NADPH)
MTENQYDVMIVGIGPAGSTAALYGQRLGLKTVVFGDTPGGITYMIENLANYPGFIGGISGTEFGVKLFQQAQMEGAEFTMSRLEKLDHNGNAFMGTDTNGLSYTAPCAIIASGRVPRRLPVAHSEMKGINFCSVCDGPLFRGKNATLAVVGSDNAAGQHAMSLSRIADKVFLICRSQTLKMDAAHQELIAQQNNIEILNDSAVTGFTGLDFVEALIVKTSDGKTSEIPVDGVFLAIGWEPNLQMLQLEAATNDDGYLKTDTCLMTSIPGLFAAGDIREKNLYQVLTACSDGARAAKYVSEFIETSNK